jgi:plasmid stability protein
MDMAQLLVRDIDDDIVTNLKEQAKQHHRSLQGEVKAILENHCEKKLNMDKVRKELMAYHASFGGKLLPDSTELIREDRER